MSITIDAARPAAKLHPRHPDTPEPMTRPAALTPPRAAPTARHAVRAATALLIASATGAPFMNTPALAASNPQQRVLTHLAATYGLRPGDVELLPLAPRDLPAGAAEFYVEAKGSHGHDNHNCVVMGERVYCSGAEGEFERLLREQALLRRADLDAAQLMRLYSLFALPRQLKYIDAGVLQRNPQDWQAYPEVAPPALSRQPDGGATLVFYATPTLALQPSKWTLRIAPDGRAEAESAAVAKR